MNTQIIANETEKMVYNIASKFNADIGFYFFINSSVEIKEHCTVTMNISDMNDMESLTDTFGIDPIKELSHAFSREVLMSMVKLYFKRIQATKPEEITFIDLVKLKGSLICSPLMIPMYEETLFFKRFENTELLYTNLDFFGHYGALQIIINHESKNDSSMYLIDESFMNFVIDKEIAMNNNSLKMTIRSRLLTEPNHYKLVERYT